VEEVYLTEHESELCPILIKYGKSLLDPKLFIKQTFILQVWNKNGILVWQKEVRDKVKAAHISPNYDRTRYEGNCNTFVYVVDDNCDEICIVVFNIDPDASNTVLSEYKI
jgi:hypothetical protein